MGKYIFASQDDELKADFSTIIDHLKNEVKANAGGGTAIDRAILHMERQIRRDQEIDREDLTQALMRWRDLAYPIGRQIQQNSFHVSDKALNAFDTIGKWLEALDAETLPDDKRFPIPSLKSRVGYNRTLIAITATVLYANAIRNGRAA